MDATRQRLNCEKTKAITNEIAYITSGLYIIDANCQIQISRQNYRRYVKNTRWNVSVTTLLDGLFTKVTLLSSMKATGVGPQNFETVQEMRTIPVSTPLFKVPLGTNSWLTCHEFEPNVNEDPPFKAANAR
ncbi:hypothetical protein TNCV_1144691 [Trichonephila clavipes]|nr:hypothetical protein TNCV_1144691 [Trichonephila clavipes]